MKIGVSSYSFSKYMKDTGADYLNICDLTAKMGFDGIEFIDLDLAVQPAESIDALADSIRTRCDALKLPVAAYTVRADFLENENEAERLMRQVDLAQRLGAGVLRHDVTWRRDVPWREIIERTKDDIRRVSEYAASKGIRTCTENHGYVLQDAHRVEALIRAVGCANYGWLVDMGNFLCADEPAVHAIPIAAPYCFHAHAKDFLMKDEDPGEGWFPTRSGRHLRGTIVGHGIVPVRECVRILKDAGYDGWLSLEFEGMEDNLTALRCGLKYLRDVTA